MRTNLAALGIAAVIISSLATFGLAGAAPSQPTTIVVTTTDDGAAANPGDGVCETAAGNGVCTLRAAVQEASHAGNRPTIQIPAGTYLLTLAGTGPEAGDLDVMADMDIVGAGADVTTIDASAVGDRVIEIGPSPGVTELSVTLSGVTLRGGQSTVGGGLYARSSGSVRVSGVRVTDNRADLGGGVYATGDAGLVISESSLDGNTAEQGGGLFVGAAGPQATTDITTTLANVTISGNTADVGGGAAVAGRLQLVHATLSANTAPEGSGLYLRGDATLANSIVAANSGGANCNNDGELTSLGGNLDSDGSCRLSAASGDRPGVDARLQPLGDNGGTTPTHALVSGSPAVDAADARHCLATDQRGFGRPSGPRCDIGSFELGGAVVATPTASPTLRATVTIEPTSTGEATSTPDVTATATTAATATQTTPPTATTEPTATIQVTATATSATPQPTATAFAGLVCDFIIGRVPAAHISQALAQPNTVSGYGELCFPSKPPSYNNGTRQWLSIQNIAVPYHQMYNRLLYKCGCP